MSPDECHQMAINRMKVRVMLAFALNRVTHMSMQELFCCVRANNLDAGENITVVATANQLCDDGILEFGYYGNETCRIPKVRVTKLDAMHTGELKPLIARARGLLPRDKRFPQPGSLPRTVLPAEIVQHIKETVS